MLGFVDFKNKNPPLPQSACQPPYGGTVFHGVDIRQFIRPLITFGLFLPSGVVSSPAENTVLSERGPPAV